jgi:hypothetical protein
MDMIDNGTGWFVLVAEASSSSNILISVLESASAKVRHTADGYKRREGP